ncbi:AprI/Inh family metalloprotease inhibitor [Enterovirga rhinocerotis]|uniref:Protease inhibitor Inh n=1 Tax=Enterovirga rhinocerotis TaxID=1339210 RepID=A0A4R7BLD6_9HYPH|nr:AprI/Inh family metalloprotease inhibitor [Enterovirga rhinocerotis]TDR85442.1 protease inhibitor Inh [Enterovirga rhinocerotis]
MRFERRKVIQRFDAVHPIRRSVLTLVVLGCSLTLAGCQSGRFGGFGSASTPRSVQAPHYAPDAVAPSVPSGSVTEEPLGPPPGGVATLGGGGEVTPMPGSSQPVPTMGGGGGFASSPTTRSSAIGSWTAKEASGSCRVTLSSTPSLDLYRASAGGCSNKELGRVTAWDFRDGEIYLFQPGGAVAARLRPGGGGLTGVLAKSGAPLSMTRG